MLRRSAPTAGDISTAPPPSSADRPPLVRGRSSQGTTTTTSSWASFFGFTKRGNNNGEQQQQTAEAEGVSEEIDQLLASIQALRTTSKMSTKTAEAQRKGAEALAKWAKRTNNNAVSDVVGWTSELMGMYAEKQTIFAKDYEHFLRQLRKVADTEQRVQSQEKQLEKLVERERRLSKQFRQRGSHEARTKLDRAVADREVAEQQLVEVRAEAEVVKMIQLRDGLMGIADAQSNLAQAGHRIFSCQRELAEFVPAVSTKDVRHMRYEGVPHTRQRVADLRRSLTTSQLQMPFNAPSSVESRSHNRRSEPPQSTTNNNSAELSQQQLQRIRRPQHGQQQFLRQLLIEQTPNSRRQRQHPQQHPQGTPPPPYTPTAPPLELFSDSAMQSASNSGRSTANRQSIGASLFSIGAFNANSASSTSAAVPFPAAPAEQNNSGQRIYPVLPPNPFAVDLKRRRARQREQSTTRNGY